MLDFANEVLDQMTLTIQPFVVPSQDFSALMRRGNGVDAAIQQVCDEIGRRVAVIRDQTLEIKAFQQMLRLGE